MFEIKPYHSHGYFQVFFDSQEKTFVTLTEKYDRTNDSIKTERHRFNKNQMRQFRLQ